MRMCLGWTAIGALVLLGACSDPPPSVAPQSAPEVITVDRADLARLRLRDLSALGRGFHGAPVAVAPRADEAALRKQLHRAGELPRTIQRPARGVR